MNQAVREVSQRVREEINPGNSVKGKVYFDIPKGAKITKLELHDSMFSRRRGRQGRLTGPPGKAWVCRVATTRHTHTLLASQRGKG